MAVAIDFAIYHRARALAAKSKRSLISELVDLTHAQPRELVQALALSFSLEVLETADMLACEPAFELLPLARALQRHCVLLHGLTGQITGVIADPFDVDLQTWMES
jgi:general secretion pathway protein E